MGRRPPAPTARLPGRSRRGGPPRVGWLWDRDPLGHSGRGAPLPRPGRDCDPARRRSDFLPHWGLRTPRRRVQTQREIGLAFRASRMARWSHRASPRGQARQSVRSLPTRGGRRRSRRPSRNTPHTTMSPPDAPPSAVGPARTHVPGPGRWCPPRDGRMGGKGLRGRGGGSVGAVAGARARRPPAGRPGPQGPGPITERAAGRRGPRPGFRAGATEGVRALAC